MNNKMTVNIKQKIKTVLSVLSAIVLILCVGLAFVGCGNDYIKYDDAIQIAKEDFGCKKILWFGSALYGRALTSDIVYAENGEMYYKERILPHEGGYYVFGLDKNGNEVYVVIPRDISSTCKPTKIDWPFDYTFSEMLDFAGPFGYKYADGIDGRIKEYAGERLSLGMNTRGDADEVEASAGCLYCESLGGRFIDCLDIKFIFTFRTKSEDAYSDFVIGQIDGKLMMLESKSDSDTPIVYTYSRDGAEN